MESKSDFSCFEFHKTVEALDFQCIDRFKCHDSYASSIWQV